MRERGEAPILRVSDLRTWFLTDAGPVRAVDGVSFDLFAGETLGIVGESGSGKSVCAKSIMRLLDEPARIVGGSITFRGRDLATLDKEAMREVRGREIAMVFQDPMTSLNPVLRIARQLVEAMTAHGRFTAAAARTRAIDLLRRMGVSAPESAVTSVSAPVLRRHAAAGDAGHGIFQRARAADRRRTDHGTGRDHPGADPRPAARVERRSRHRGDPDQPRSRRDQQSSARACS